MKGVILTPDIAKIFHPTADVKAKKANTQNLPPHSTPTFQKAEKNKKKCRVLDEKFRQCRVLE